MDSAATNNNNNATEAGKTDTRSLSSPSKRPQTPHDFSLLKSLRLQHNATSTPSPEQNLSRADHSPETAAVSSSQPSATERGAPHTPTRFSTLAPVTDSLKRDSALATSTSRSPSVTASEKGSVVHTPSQPSHSVKNGSPRPEKHRSRSSFLRRRYRYGPKTADTTEKLSRVQSFHGISLDIPSAELEDLSPKSDRLQFSNRGSLLLGGEKMEAMIAGEGDKVKAEEAKQAGTGAQNEEEQPRPSGLKSGRRKPSVHMLKAAIEGRRVLSAEEISYSMRIRSMYEHGDENAVDWTKPMQDQDTRDTTPELEDANDQPTPSSPTPEIGSFVTVRKTRQSGTNGHPRPVSAANKRMSYIPKETETAGGLEDWEDIGGKDVDRYGFISPERILSNAKAAENIDAAMRPKIQRVSTSLQLIANSPRKKRGIRRTPSNATRRTAASAAPNRGKDARSLRTQSSLYSFRSTSSSIFDRPLRSRTTRLMDEASFMLTLPPGLAAIAEQDDGGRSATWLKRREWTREEKWRSMARLTTRGPKGSGMRFDFDSRDPLLISRTWKGIPDRWRSTAWHSFLVASAKRRGKYVPDAELIASFHELQEQNSADDVQIDVDVPRTISMHVMFRKRYRGGQRLLFRVLHALGLYFPDVGYVQGMASLAATLLCYFDEEEAFVMMVRMWELRGLKTLFRAGFDGLMSALKEFEIQWLGTGQVASTLTELGIDGTAYGTRWYLTLFNMSVPFPAQLRIWDVFMLLGDKETPTSSKGAAKATTAAASKEDFDGADLDVLHATSAALIDATRDIILDSDFENAMKVLTSFIPVKDEDLLMRVAKAEYKAKKKRDSKG